MSTRECKRCLNQVDQELFKRSTTHPDGYFSWCRPCTSEYMSIYNTARTLGITPDEVRRIKATYATCVVCGREVNGKQQCIDHNHDTMLIRGVLCLGCNIRVGVVENGDSVSDLDILSKIIDYLDIYDPTVFD